MTFPFNPWRKPSALTLAVEQLEQAQRDRLTASASAEHYNHIESMLDERIIRLKLTVDELKGEAP
jgi:hypothetical protein